MHTIPHRPSSVYALANAGLCAAEHFDAAAYWSKREAKIWVVAVKGRRDARQITEPMYVRARTREGAGRCALGNSLLTAARVHSVRLATPHDLGCVRVTA